MRRKARQESSSTGSWLTTYSDMVTLLLAFFVLLFAFSAVDEDRFQAVITAFQGYFGIFDGAVVIQENPITLPFQSSKIAEEQLQALYAELTKHIEEEGMTGVELEMQERGVIIRFAEQVFFDLGEAILKPEAQGILHRLADTLRSIPNPIRVEGHTDDWPIKTSRFPSNWELSVHRATNVVRHLIEKEGFNAQNLSALGYAEHRPLRPNDNAQNRALNRRVDIVILNIDLWGLEPN